MIIYDFPYNMLKSMILNENESLDYLEQIGYSASIDWLPFKQRQYNMYSVFSAN
jgi:hypothetical protein